MCENLSHIAVSGY